MKKFLFIVHIYYKEQIKELSSLISNLCLEEDEYDIYITSTNETVLEDELNIIFHNAVIIRCKNIGYDLWPFFYVLKNVDIADYCYLVKVHTKRNLGYKIVHIDKKFYFWGWQWKRLLLSFLSRNNFNKSIRAFENDPNLGMVNSYILIDKCFSDEEQFHFKYCFDKVNLILEKLGFNSQDPIRYIAGTMFICRADLFCPLKNLDYTESDFNNVDRNNENDLPHVLERLFGAVITAQGFKIEDPYTSFLSKIFLFFISSFIWITTHRYIRKISRFLFRIDHDKSNCKKIVKVFKIKILELKCK